MVRGEAHEAGGLDGRAARHHVAVRERADELAVDGETGSAAAFDLDPDRPARVEHEGAVEQHVRRHWREQQRPVGGYTTGPRADNAYAVDPVGVATMSPSAAYRVNGSLAMRAFSRTVWRTSVFSTTVSLSARENAARMSAAATTSITRSWSTLAGVHAGGESLEGGPHPVGSTSESTRARRR